MISQFGVSIIDVLQDDVLELDFECPYCCDVCGDDNLLEEGYYMLLRGRCFLFVNQGQEYDDFIESHTAVHNVVQTSKDIVKELEELLKNDWDREKSLFFEVGLEALGKAAYNSDRGLCDEVVCVIHKDEERFD